LCHRHGRPELREQPRAGDGADEADQADGKGGETLVLASSDLSHYHTYDDAVKMDHKTLDALEKWDYFKHVAQLSRHAYGRPAAARPL